jgi:tRNA A37 methylthiotransferase MiaB
LIVVAWFLPPGYFSATDTNAMTKKVFIETVGCQMNSLDSEMVMASLRKSGYDLTPTSQEADVLLFNTCSIPATRRRQSL